MRNVIGIDVALLRVSYLILFTSCIVSSIKWIIDFQVGGWDTIISSLFEAKGWKLVNKVAVAWKK